MGAYLEGLLGALFDKHQCTADEIRELQREIESGILKPQGLAENRLRANPLALPALQELRSGPARSHGGSGADHGLDDRLKLPLPVRVFPFTRSGSFLLPLRPRRGYPRVADLFDGRVAAAT